MKKKPEQKADKNRLNFHITPVLYDQLAEFAKERGFARVSEAAWFLLHAAMMKRDDEKRFSPPPREKHDSLILT
jgi:hypothetical protein